MALILRSARYSENPSSVMSMAATPRVLPSAENGAATVRPMRPSVAKTSGGVIETALAAAVLRYQPRYRGS